ncbi:MAG: magnesium transporter CorA family protein [Rhodovibrionaceae bacterium]|nr:magnesium transporter CorA family protein [Rhodovibrionaceae bacterium]
MIRSYRVEDGQVSRSEGAPQASQSAQGVVWVDLFQPTDEEAGAVGRWLGVVIPSPDEMQEIEASSRLYHDQGAYFMTATLVTRADTENPESAVVTFVLLSEHLITIRYTDPQPFRTFERQAERDPELLATPESAFLGILEAIADRLADILEVVGADLDATSREIFRPAKKPRTSDFQGFLIRIGQDGDLTSKARESLVTLDRMETFARALEHMHHDRGLQMRLKTLSRDITSITDYTAFLNGKVNFLLDATLGMISTEQNAIIKLFSLVAVVFLPPTLIASIYGMNFQHMPELGWPFGYPLALLLMLLSAVLPYLFFKKRGWL